MPRLSVKTISAEKVWASPDGQRVIHKLVLDYQGKQFGAKTYSQAIAVPGWSGEVDTEERPGKMGPETFVKQPPKEGGFSGGAKYSGGGKQADPFAMYLSYAKDLAVAFIGLEGELDTSKYTKALEAVAEGGKALFDVRPDAHGTPATAGQPKVADSVTEVFGDDVVVEDIGDEPLQLSDLQDIG